MAEDEVTALKVALCNQYIIIQELFAELEEEREASATAASEALSMILRLQREKAAEKMEASQYKRMADEKLHHAEECLEFLEEVIQQNEMEISSLMYQIETYKRKLARDGVNIADVGQINISEEQSCTDSNVLMEKTGVQGFLRRHISLPSLFPLDQVCSEMDISNDSTLVTSKQSILKKVNDEYDESGIGDGDSPVWKQAEEMNRKLKELIQDKNVKEIGSCSSVATTELLRPLSVGSIISDQESGSCSYHSIVSVGTSYDSTGTGRKSDDQAVSCLHSQVRGSGKIPESDGPGSSCLEAEPSGNTVLAAGLHGIFEMSESCEDCNFDQPYDQVLEESVHVANYMSGMPNLIRQESADCLFRGDDWLRKAFMDGHYETNLSPSREGPFLQQGSKLPTPSKGTSSDYRSLGDPKVEISVSQLDFEQLKLQQKQLYKKIVVMQEVSERSKEQLILLRDIFKKINTIETHMKRSTSKKYSARDDSKIFSVMEAVLTFSI